MRRSVFDRSWAGRALVAFGVVVASYTGISVVLAGLRLIGRATDPVAFGQGVSGDLAYPDGARVAGGLLLLVLGAGVCATALAAAVGHRLGCMVGAVLLAAASVGLAVDAVDRAEERRCVDDTYLGEQRCVSVTWSATRSITATSLPLLVGAAGMVLASRSPLVRPSDDGEAGTSGG